eukprot:1927029-Pleurochrysis_carterae.AAC.1
MEGGCVSKCDYVRVKKARGRNNQRDWESARREKERALVCESESERAGGWHLSNNEVNPSSSTRSYKATRFR